MGCVDSERRQIYSGDTKYGFAGIQSMAPRAQAPRWELADPGPGAPTHQAVIFLMGRMHIKELGGFRSSENTLDEYDNEVSEELLDHHLKRIAAILGESEDSVCYVLGMGAQRKETYMALQKESGIDVVWTRSILPGLLKVLSVVVASYSGLVKVLDSQKLPSVTAKLSHLSMAGIYIIDRSREKEFIDCVSKYPVSRDFDFGVKSDSRYFLLLVDADNSESSTGIMEVVSCGRNSALVNCI
jgi:hypothetical protein